MKKLGSIFAVIALSATMLVCCFAFTGCGSVAGTYTTVIASHDYYAQQSVKDYIKNNPGKYVATDTLFVMLNSDIGTIGDGGTTFKTEGGVDDYYTVTLELKDGGKYSLTKQFKMGATAATMTQLPEGKTPEIKITFEGSYTSDGDNVTLKAPTAVKGNFVIAGAGAAYTCFANNYENFELAETDKDELTYAGKFFYYFNTMNFIVSESITDMSVTLDTSEKMTFQVA